MTGEHVAAELRRVEATMHEQIRPPPINPDDPITQSEGVFLPPLPDGPLPTERDYVPETAAPMLTATVVGRRGDFAGRVLDGVNVHTARGTTFRECVEKLVAEVERAQR